MPIDCQAFPWRERRTHYYYPFSAPPQKASPLMPKKCKQLKPRVLCICNPLVSFFLSPGQHPLMLQVTTLTKQNRRKCFPQSLSPNARTKLQIRPNIYFESLSNVLLINHLIILLRCFSPPANYADRATAACRRS
jgi:hypothetical protein